MRRIWLALDGDLGRTRMVGGAVRDALLGLPVSDIDFATQFTPDEVSARLRQAGIAAVPTGLAHGTITAVIDHAGFEVTTLRQDLATDGRHATVAFTRDWLADAQRRDLTINALYADPQGRIFDPLGAGLPDLAAGRVRFVGDPARRIAEDYLRLLRFFRTHACYGRGPLDEAGVTAAQAAAGSLHRLAGERIWQEFAKLLQAPQAGVVLARMADVGILTSLFDKEPEMAVFEKFVKAEAALSPTPRLIGRFVALAGGQAPLLAQRWHFSRRQSLAIAQAWQLAAEVGVDDQPWTALRRHGKEAVIDSLLLARARSDAAPCPEARALAIAQAWQEPVFPVTGADVLALGVPPGPRVGVLLAQTARWWEEGGCLAGREDCLARLQKIASS